MTFFLKLLSAAGCGTVEERRSGAYTKYACAYILTQKKGSEETAGKRNERENSAVITQSLCGEIIKRIKETK